MPPTDNHKNSKRIAKNTFLLYIRMAFVMLVTLYSSRVVLDTLGVEDFGIYNVVGGVVLMFGFLNSSMASATNRFYSYEIGLGDPNRLSNVFSMSILLHLLMGIILVLLAETIGLWFVKTQLVIPPSRFEASITVYQFSVFSFFFSIITIPFSALLIAYEQMGHYALIGILDVLLRLLVVIGLKYVKYDLLILYSALLFGVVAVIFLIYFLYFIFSFRTVKFCFTWDTSLFKVLFKHSGWMLFGTSANMLSYQGVNMLINMFFGVTINAARSIAYQIQSAVNSFITNFMTAVNPQIIKLYARREEDEMHELSFRASRFSYFLVFILALPVLLLTKEILGLWLVDVPDMTIIFSKLTILDLFFTVLYGPLATVTQATGRIKHYQLAISVVFLLMFIFTYTAFKLGASSVSAFVIALAMSFLGLAIRIIILDKNYNFPTVLYLKRVILPIVFVSLMSVPFPLVCRHYLDKSVIDNLLVLSASVLSTVISIWVVGIEKSERAYFIQLVRRTI